MSKEMLFLCDTYTEFLQKNNLPHRCASELLYSSDTMNKLTVRQTYWLENFISTWDIIATHAQEIIMTAQLHEFYVTRKCTKMEYFTVKAESMEDAKYEAEHGYDYYDFDWEEFDYETVNIKEQEIPEQQLTLASVGMVVL